jgi:virginiamycin B lyase
VRFGRLPVIAAVAVSMLVPLGCGGSGTTLTTGPGDESAAAKLRGPKLVSALRRGGLVVYFRHAATDMSMTDTSLANCRTQRNLDERGRADARAIGRAWKDLRIPVGAVLSSRYCRTKDTARLAFGRFRMTDHLTGIASVPSVVRERRRRALRRLLSTPPTRANTILVAHLFNIQDAANISLAEGEAAVFRPLGRGRFRLENTVLPRAWARLAPAARAFALREYRVPAGTHPHDVAPARDGSVWYTAQGAGAVGRLDPATGRSTRIPLGEGSAPHGVIVGPDGAPWITDGGLNAIVRVDPRTKALRVYRLPASSGWANLNTAVFDRRGILWFTGQTGTYGRLDPRYGSMRVFRAPRGDGPYGITVGRDGFVYYASLAGSYVGRVDPRTWKATVLEPPTRGQGARRAWADSRGRVWISEWNAGRVGRYDPRTRRWREWRLPGPGPQPYAIYVDDRDIVWLSDFGANAIVRFDPRTERFRTIRLPSRDAAVRQLLGRPGQLWGAESAVDRLVVIRTR